MSTFDEREPFKKILINVSLTKEQKEEFDRIKTRLGVSTNGAVIKAGLALLSRQLD